MVDYKKMLNFILMFIAGLVFGIGLLVAGMTNPAQVLAFLDVAGIWNPGLALVMLAAMLVAGFGFMRARRMASSLQGSPMHLPANRRPDIKLVLGSALFGVGWGLAGICPGPALVLLGTGASKGIIVVLAMLGGMIAYQLLEIVTSRWPD